jgi:hypothetical protein
LKYDPNYIEGLEDEDLWSVYSDCLRELKKRGLIRTKNVVGERGEELVLKIYNSIPNEPKLQMAPKGTKNVDAISRKGERYTIKTVCLPNKKTSVFYGIEPKDSGKDSKKVFEYAVIIILDENLKPVEVLEIDWEKLLKLKRWDDRMRSWNVTITEELRKNSRIVFKR